MYRAILAALIADHFKYVDKDVDDQTLDEWVRYARGFDVKVAKAEARVDEANKKKDLLECAWLYSVFATGSPEEITTEPTLGKAIRFIESKVGRRIDRTVINYNITREDYRAPIQDAETKESFPYYIVCRPGTKKRRNELKAQREAERAAEDLAKAQARAEKAAQKVAEAEALPDEKPMLAKAAEDMPILGQMICAASLAIDERKAQELNEKPEITNAEVIKTLKKKAPGRRKKLEEEIRSRGKSTAAN